MINSVVTIGGQGSRLKQISPKDKHLLYWNNKRIIEWIQDIVPSVNIIGTQKTSSRWDTLQEVKDSNNCLIIDCDIIPFGLTFDFDLTQDNVWCFHSNKQKWGSVQVENNKLVAASETGNISNVKLSGVYYAVNMSKTLDIMKKVDKNSIAKALIGANTIVESTFIRLGDIEDYFEAIKYIHEK